MNRLLSYKISLDLVLYYIGIHVPCYMLHPNIHRFELHIAIPIG